MSGYRLDRLKVLIVDDHQHMRNLLASILQAFGTCNIFQAADGKEAWDFLNRQPCDIAFVDCVMSDESGMKLTKRIRTSRSSPNPLLPIVMVTSETNAKRVIEARDVGANEIIAKPLSVQAVYTRLLSIIEFPRPFVRTKVYFGPCRRRRRDTGYQGQERRASNDEVVDLDAQTPVPAARVA